LNIFVLDTDVEKAAKWHVDRHVVKMPLETAQMLCTARHELGEAPERIPYRKAYVNHPCTIWARESYANYKWLCNMGVELCKEYTYRYGKVHKCQAVIESCIENTPNSDDASTDWFDVESNISLSASSSIYHKTFTLNANWLRILHTPTSGSIDKILVRN